MESSSVENHTALGFGIDKVLSQINMGFQFKTKPEAFASTNRANKMC